MLAKAKFLAILATLESYLAGHHEVVLPAAIISGTLFLICAGLYLFVRRIDTEARSERKDKVD